MKPGFGQSNLGIWIWTESCKWAEMVEIRSQWPVFWARCLAVSTYDAVSESILTEAGYDLVVLTVWLPLVSACFFPPSLVLQSSCWFCELLDILPINSFPAKISQSVSIACDQELHLYTALFKALCAYWISGCWMTKWLSCFIRCPSIFSVWLYPWFYLTEDRSMLFYEILMNIFWNVCVLGNKWNEWKICSAAER